MAIYNLAAIRLYLKNGFHVKEKKWVFFVKAKKVYKHNDLVNIKQATELLNVSRQTVWHWMKAGAIRPVTVAGRDFIEMATVREIQDKLEKKAEIQKFFAGEK